MKLNKYNWKIKEYEKIEVPDTWNVKLYTENMDEIIHCPHCGRQGKFGSCYTSREIHTEMGMGYAVCELCYNKEFEREKEEN